MNFVAHSRIHFISHPYYLFILACRIMLLATHGEVNRLIDVLIIEIFENINKFFINAIICTTQICSIDDIGDDIGEIVGNHRQSAIVSAFLIQNNVFRISFV